MTRTSIWLASLAAMGASLSACSPTSSSTGGPEGGPVPTTQMRMHARVESRDNSQAVVSVYLDNGALLGGQQYRLDGGDYLRACVGGQCRNLRDDFSIIDVLFPFYPNGYSNNLSFLSDTDYVIAFNRPAGGNAPMTYVSLPPAFNIVSPVSNQQVTDGDAVWVEWLPIGVNERIDVDTDADCYHWDGLRTEATLPHGYDGDRDGRELIHIDDIIRVARTLPISPTQIQRCNITITVEHERSGVVDAAFNGGHIEGVVSRRVRLIYYPR